MTHALRDWILAATSADKILEVTHVQSLWSGYGEILRLSLSGGPRTRVILKRVAPPSQATHPRGWSTDRSHQRKLRSYQVEAAWYRDFATSCDEACRVPQMQAERQSDGETWFLLEDLDAAGFPGRRRAMTPCEIEACLGWLAAFHATFLGRDTTDLWQRGTYWHLATRPDELAATRDAPLREAAAAIDAKIESAAFKTLVHGDAKPANFCFSPDGEQVAAVDFQYVGGGVGVQDVAYLLGACLGGRECEDKAEDYLERYLASLQQELAARRPGGDPGAVAAEWRELFPWAWADFERFLAGWAPGHGKRTGYSEALTRGVLAQVGRV